MIFLITFTQQHLLLYLATSLFLGGNYILLKRRFQKGGFDFNTSHFYLGLIFSLTTSFAFFNLGFKPNSIEEIFFEEDLDPIIEVVIPRTKQEKKKVAPKLKKVRPEKIKEIILIDLVDEPVETEEKVEEPPQENIEAPVVQAINQDVPPIVVPEVIEEKDEVIFIAEQMPRFPGCEEIDGSNKEKEACAKRKMLRYIYENLDYPIMARENRIEGMSVIQFVVGKNGEVRDIKILRDTGAGCGNAAYQVVQDMNNLPERWTPGKQRGKPVSVRYTLPIKFKLK